MLKSKVHSFQGAQYLNKGFHLLWKPGIKRFVFVPLTINFILLGFASYYAIELISDWHNELPIWIDAQVNSEHWYISWPASGLEWLIGFVGWLFWPLVIASVLITVFFLFGFLANWIAAPFNGLLSEAVEEYLISLDGGQTAETKFNMSLFLKDIPRLIGRELRKLAYYLPRAILILLLLITPISPLVPIIWFLFNAWMSAIQYIDYPEDNHQHSFQHTMSVLGERRSGPFGFGVVVMLFTMIPVINILVMPVAVAGATNLWVDHYREQ